MAPAGSRYGSGICSLTARLAQGEGGVEGEAAVAVPDSVLEFGTIRATSLPLGFNLPDALDGTQASMDGSGPAVRCLNPKP